MKILIFTLSVTAGILSCFVTAHAEVTLFAEGPQTASVGADTPIELKARLTESINALKVSVVISPDSAEIARFDDTDSVVRLWLQRGVPTAGGVVLEGVIPGGVGPAFTDVVSLGTLWVRPVTEGRLRITFENAEVYLNQPNATRSEVQVNRFDIPVTGPGEVTRSDTSDAVITDYEVRIVSDANIAAGARTVLFDIKTDHGTVDRVRIRERWFGVWGSWRDAMSPSTLSDRWGVSILDIALKDADGGAGVTTVVPLPLKIIWSMVALGILTIAARRFKLRR